MHGLMRHKTRGHEMKVAIGGLQRTVSRQNSLCRVVSKINSDRLQVTENEGSYAQPSLLLGSTVFRLSWFPCRCVVTTASTSITQCLESEEVAFSVVHVHRAPLPVLRQHFRKDFPIVTCLNTQRSIPIFHVCLATLVPVDVVGL